MRTTFRRLAVTGVTASMLLAAVPARAQQFTMKLSQPTINDVTYEYFKRMKAGIEQRSAGKIKVEGDMTKLKIGALPDERPVKVSVELPASVHRDLVDYAKAFASESHQPISDPVRLIAPMLARFMATDRAFAKARRKGQPAQGKG